MRKVVLVRRRVSVKRNAIMLFKICFLEMSEMSDHLHTCFFRINVKYRWICIRAGGLLKEPDVSD